MKQIQCSNCKQYKLWGNLTLFLVMGIAFVFTGSLFSLFIITAIIGIPMIVLGLLMLAFGIVSKALAVNNPQKFLMFYCTNCKKIYKGAEAVALKG